MKHAILADVGVPMIFIEWPLMLCALLPVIIIEAFVVRRQLSLSHRNAFAGATKANVISTLAGVPLAWVIMFAIELALLPVGLAAQKWHWRGESPVFYFLYLLGIAWTGPPGTSFWPIALAAALLLIPTFFVSVWLERWSYRRSWPGIDPAVVNRSVWSANLWSYALLFAAACGWVGWEVYKGGDKAPPVNRLVQEHPIDLASVHDSSIVCPDADSRQTLVRAVAQLEVCWADFYALMHNVESGKIAVKRNLSSGRWQTQVNTRDSWTHVTYRDRLGPVSSVQKHPNNGSMTYMFMFNGAGYVTNAHTRDGEFLFDETGRFRQWHGYKIDCWGNRGK